MSSSFVEYSIEDTTLIDHFKFECKWSSNSQYLAVSTYSKHQGGNLTLLSESGNVLEAEQLIQKTLAFKSSSKINNFEWHPKLPIVACFWDNQVLGCFSIQSNPQRWLYNEIVNNREEDDNEDERKTRDTMTAKQRIKSAILNQFRVVCMLWINEGDELFTVSSGGELQLFEYKMTSNQFVELHSQKLNESVADAVALHSTKESFVYVGYRSGVVCRWSSTQRQLIEVIQIDSGIQKLLLSKQQLRLVVVTDQLQLCQFSLIGEEVAEISKIKLPALGRVGNNANNSKPGNRNTSRDISALLIDEPNGILALCVFGERLVRLFQLDSGQNLAVLVVESADFHWAGVSALAFCAESELLIAGTSNNHVVIWQREYNSPKETKEENENQVQFNKVGEIKVKGAVNCLTVSNQSRIAFTSSQHELSFIEKQVMKSFYSHNLIAIQTSAKQVRLIHLPELFERICSTECQIKDIHIGSDGSYLAFRSNFPKNVHIYECMDSLEIQFHSALTISSGSFVIYKDCLWFLSQSSGSTSESCSLHCIRLKGAQDEHIHPINFKELTTNSSGVTSISFELNNGQLLMLFKLQGVARYIYLVFNVNQKQSAQLTHGPIVIEPEHQLLCSRISSDGKVIAFKSSDRVWLLKAGSQQHLQPVNLLQLNLDSQMHFSADEARILVVQTSSKNLNVLLCWLRNEEDQGKVSYRIYEHKRLELDSYLLGIRMPQTYLLRNEIDENGNSSSALFAHVLTEFNGVNSQTISVMLDFLTAGRADLNAMIRKIARSGEQDEKLWMNLARIAVKSGNVKMGQYCAARLGWSFVVREVKTELLGNQAFDQESDLENDDEEDDDDTLEEDQKSSFKLNLKNQSNENEDVNDEELDAVDSIDKLSSDQKTNDLNSIKSRECAALAVLASNLGLYDEAEHLLKQSGQLGKLVEFFINRNQWERAVETSERLMKRSVHYELARYYEEEEQNLTAAIDAFERAGCAASEVPRLLFDAGNIEQLKKYCLQDESKLKSKLNKESLEKEEHRPVAWSEVFTEGWWDEREQLIRWWAQYNESVGDLGEAVQAYEQAGDYSNWVRLLCLGGSLNKARQILSEHEANAVERLSQTLSQTQKESKLVDLLEPIAFEPETKSSQQLLEKRKAEAEILRKDAALLYVARQLETNEPDEAVKCFLACGAIQHAMRVCRQNDLKAQLIKIVASHGTQTEVLELIEMLKSQLQTDPKTTDSTLFDVAEQSIDSNVLDQQQLFEQLMQLHYRVKDFDSCVRFGLQGRLFAHVRALLESEIEQMDEQKEMNQEKGRSSLHIRDETLEIALKLLRENEQLVDLVMDLLLLRGEHAELIRDIIVEYRVRLDEHFFVKVNRVLNVGKKASSTAKNRLLLQSLADCSLQQGEYLVAAKLFNSADDRPNAVRSLARAGDTQKLITYAGIARDKSVYRIAANYLQTLGSGHEKTIEQFYRKAGAKEELQRYLNQNN